MSTFHLQLLLILVDAVFMLFAATINSVHIKDNVTTLKGSSVQLVCSISGFMAETVPIPWYKTDTQQVVQSGEQTQCLATMCTTRIRQGYTFTSNNSGMYVDITGLSQESDGKWWTCGAVAEQANLQLVVYTVPQSLLYERPTEAQDLSVNNVTLKCTTDCAYPAPTISWFYIENGARQQYSASGVVTTGTDSSCTDSEKRYRSTLTLALYTTFTGNADKTVGFECGIPSFPGLTVALYTPKSPEIAFAVKVTTITLKDGPAEVTSSSVINVTRGVTKTLICSPSSSRPAATIVGYIGNVERQKFTSTIFTFTPSDNDHDKQIYCKAFNFATESQGVFSEKPTLYVQVAPDIDAVVSPAILRENSSVNVNCNAKGGRPETYRYTALQQTWKGTVIPNTHSHLSGTSMYSSVALTSLQFQDTGNYTCHVNNGVTDSSGVLDHTSTVYVQVEVSPKILAQQTFYGDVGESLNISVPFYSYPAATEVVFTRERGGPIMNSTKYTVSHHTAPVMTQFYGTDVTLDGNTAVLQITDLEKVDFTSYTIMVTNSLGTNAQTISLSSQKPLPEDPPQVSAAPVGAIVGGIVAAVVVIIVIAVIIFLKRRKSTTTTGSKSTHSNKSDPNENKTDDDEVITENLNYESAETKPYPTVQKADKPIDPSALYAVPDKKKDPSALYAVPDKKKADKKNKKNKKQKKKGAAEDGDIYENASPENATAASGGKKPKKKTENPKPNVNKDGLLYSEVVFNTGSKGQKKPVIHGQQEMTEYSAVDFSKKADPLPENYEEDQTAKNK